MGRQTKKGRSPTFGISLSRGRRHSLEKFFRFLEAVIFITLGNL